MFRPRRCDTFNQVGLIVRRPNGEVAPALKRHPSQASIKYCRKTSLATRIALARLQKDILERRLLKRRLRGLKE